MRRIATDGSSGRDGTGAWAWVDEAGVSDGLYYPAHATNQKMELAAVRYALDAADYDEDVEIISDSAYVVNCMNDGWLMKWIANGWRNSKGRPVSNQILWRHTFRTLLNREGATIFTHVRGHQGHPLNEQADTLAVRLRREGKAGKR